MVSGCGDFMEWDELKVLKTIAEDLDPVNHLTLGKADDNIRMAYDSRRAQLYLAPTISQDEAMVMEAWNNRLWMAMKTWEGADPLHKKMVAPLEVAYYRALVKLENHYLGRNFKQKQAQVLLLIEIDSEDTKCIIPGKLFEYMVSNRPIIALGPKESDVERIINETNTGDYFYYNDFKNLKKPVHGEPFD